MAISLRRIFRGKNIRNLNKQFENLLKIKAVLIQGSLFYRYSIKFEFSGES
jgi:hypothetical protein